MTDLELAREMARDPMGISRPIYSQDAVRIARAVIAQSARISALEAGLREALELLGPPGVASWKDLRIAELRKLVTP